MGIPAPEPGLVLNYAYLWHHEHNAGRDEGRKDRPSVIVLCQARRGDGATIVTVLPITHAKPLNPKTAMEIPARIKKALGLDDDRSWIVIDEVNEFAWPGYDLRKIRNTNNYAFGFLPPLFFNRVLEAFVALARGELTKTTPRF
jgi:hypothetical protein